MCTAHTYKKRQKYAQIHTQTHTPYAWENAWEQQNKSIKTVNEKR